MSVRVLTNLRRLNEARVAGFAPEVASYAARPRNVRDLVALYRQLGAVDYVLINCSPVDLLLVCLLRALRPWSRCRIVSLDTVLPVPRRDTFGQRARLWAKILLFKGVDLFIEYFRDTRGYERWYRIPRAKFRYVPFKINRYERVVATPTRDDGYIFCGGNTRRDFATLTEAVRERDYPVRIVTMGDETIRGHGSFLDTSRLPDNVEVVRHDGSDSFVDHIAAARLVVLPIRRENISASGIGVYLASMALGKCVIISSGPAVDGVIPDGSAIVVPPEDVSALRAAIDRAYGDVGVRETIGQRARSYALGLGGEEQLAASVLRTLADDWRARHVAEGGRAPPVT